MNSVQDNHVVEIMYTLTNEDGEQISSTKKGNPLAFIQGGHQIPPGLEREIQGKQTGDTFKVILPPEQAYGIRDETLVQTLPIDDFGPDAKSIVAGDLIQIQNYNGQIMAVQAVKVSDVEITLDANHQLAGKTLAFDVEVVSIREATPDELVNGHPMIESCCASGSCGQ